MRPLAAALGLLLGGAGCAAEPPPLGPPGGGLVAGAWVLGGDGDDRALDLARTAEGGAVVVGTYRGRLVVGDLVAPGTAGRGLFLARFSPGGRPLWLSGLPLEGGGIDQVRLALDPTDAPVVAATVLRDTIDVGTGPLPASGPSDPGDLLVLRLDPDGRPARAVRLGGPGQQVLNGLAVGASGDVWLSGRYVAFDVGLGPLAAAGSGDGFVLRLSRTLRPRWQVPIPSPGLAVATAVGVGPDDRCAVAVLFDAPPSVGGLDLGPSGPGAGLVWIGPEGAVDRGVALGAGALDLQLLDVDVDGSGLAHVGGSYRGALRLPGIARPSRGIDGLWIRADPSGPIEGGSLGGPGNDRVRAVSSDDRGRTWITGAFEGPLPFLPRPLEPASTRAAFLARVDGDRRSRVAAAVRPTDDGSVYPAEVTGGGDAGPGWWLGGFRRAATVDGQRITGADDDEVLLLRLAPR